MSITPSYLRENLYTILDQAAETGASPEIMRKGRKLRIIADRKPDVFAQLKKHPRVLRVDAEEVIYNDWSRHWHHALP